MDKTITILTTVFAFLLTSVAILCSSVPNYEDVVTAVATFGVIIVPLGYWAAFVIARAERAENE